MLVVILVDILLASEEAWNQIEWAERTFWNNCLTKNYVQKIELL